MREGIAGVDVVMMLRLQLERMNGALYRRCESTSASTGWTRRSSPRRAGAKVMHPGR
jgi:aspartate carbamoyltransferase catalytic subunit